MHYMIGAYSLIVLDGKKLIAARDPNGYRPLCIGRVGAAGVPPPNPAPLRRWGRDGPGCGAG
ncbi:MAG: hypothetical protein ACLSAF_02965 [Intestinimonas sp.]